MTIRAVFFDMDGTLVDSEATHHRALTDVLTQLGLPKPEGFDEAMTGQSMQALYDALAAKMALPLTYAEMAAAKYQAFLARGQELQWRPGAQAAWVTVQQAGLGQAVVSNSDRMLLDASLRALGLSRPDLISVSRNDVRQGKPLPEPYLRAAWLLDVPPDQCLVVEDSLAGSRAALAAGMQVIGWPEPGRPDMRFDPGVRVAPPDELCGLLASLL
ncbi:MAG: hypothetical protein RI907_371 [Pseudomonadota bacterium]|jgi:HAD superfamily hydrolase (TIGR01509 family)